MAEANDLRSELVELLKRNMDPGTFMDQVRSLVKPSPEELGRVPAAAPPQSPPEAPATSTGPAAELSGDSDENPE